MWQTGIGQLLSHFDCPQRLLKAGLGSQDEFGGGQRLAQRRAIGQCQDQHRQHTTGQGSGRVPMGQRSQLGTQPEGVLGRFVLPQAPGEQTDRRNPHDAAATLAVVAGRLPERVHRPQGR
ncbi:hypothetical protein D3C81_1762130 [compost metagenome]